MWHAGVASLPALALACGSTDAGPRPFRFADADRLREPYHALISPDGRRIAFALGDTLWVRETDHSGRRDTPVAISAGLEFTRAGDPFMAWSPDGRRLLFQADPLGRAGRDWMAAPVFVADFDPEYAPLVRHLLADSGARAIARVINAGNLGHVIATRRGGPAWSPTGQSVAFFAWPTGDGDAALQLYVAEVETGRLERWTNDASLKTGVAWSPDGQRVAVARVTEAGGGRIELIGNDRSRRTAVLHEGKAFFGDLAWAPDGRRLFVRPHRGAPFLLTVPEDERHGAGTTRELPHGTYAGWTPDGAGLVASMREGMGSRLVLVDPTSAGVRFLTGPDSFFVATSVGGTPRQPVVSFTLETGATPADVWVARLREGGALDARQRITAANEWMDMVAVAQARVVRWPAPDGTTLTAQLLLPAVWQGTPPLPLVVMPYGAYVNNFAGGEDFLGRGLQTLVARGVAVVRPNTRGIASEAQTDGYGEVQLADTHRLLDALARDGVIDPARVALLGHSHGGAMVYYFLTHSNRFAGGVAVNGAADWISQARRRDMTGLPWGLGGTPDELPDKYRLFSPLANVHAVVAPVLAVAGVADSQIPAWNATAMVDSLRSRGKTAELLLFTDEDHWIRNPANVRILWDEIMAFLEDALQLPADGVEDRHAREP